MHWSCPWRETYSDRNHRKGFWLWWLHLSKLWLNTYQLQILLVVFGQIQISICTKYLMKDYKIVSFLDNSITKVYCGSCHCCIPSTSSNLLKYYNLLSRSIQLCNKGYKIWWAASYCEYSFYSWETRIKLDVQRNHQAIAVWLSCRKTQIFPRATLKNVIWPDIWIPGQIRCGFPLLNSKSET